MSKQTLVKLMEAAAVNEQLRQQLQEAGSYEAKKALASARGFNLGHLSLADAKRTVDVLTGEVSDNLSNEELALVSDGCLNFEAIKAAFNLSDQVYGKLTETGVAVIRIAALMPDKLGPALCENPSSNLSHNLSSNHF